MVPCNYITYINKIYKYDNSKTKRHDTKKKHDINGEVK